MKLSYFTCWLTLLFACTSPEAEKKERGDTPTSSEPIAVEVDTAANEPIQVPDTAAQVLEEREVNGYLVYFLPLAPELAGQMQVFRTTMPLVSPEPVVIQQDSCFVLKLLSGSYDKLCNFDDGEYFETFEVKGFWKEKNQLLVNFTNWEEQHDYLIDLRSGKPFILGPGYELSSDRNMICTYVDISANPIYINEIMVASFQADSLHELFRIDPSPYTVTRAGWTDDSELLLRVARLSERWTVVGEWDYLMRFEKK